MSNSPLPSSARRPLPCAPEAIDHFLSQPRADVADLLSRAAGPFLVLGAGGKIGLHLALMLRQTLDQLGRHDEVIAVSRFSSLRSRTAFEQSGILTRSCDLTDRASLCELPKAPIVFFLAGVKFGTAAAPELLHAINIEMPHRVAERFSEARIVAFSSGCVYPFVSPASGGATEATPPSPIGDYARSCLAREQAFASLSRQHGTRVALIRLNYSVEFRYGLLVDIAQRVLAGQPVDVTTGWVNVIWQSDAVAHTIRALELAGTPAVTINVTGPAILSVRELAHRFGAAFQRPVRIVGQEAETAWLNNAGRSHELFGRPQTSVDDMVAWVAEWLLRGGETWGKPTGFENRNGCF